MDEETQKPEIIRFYISKKSGVDTVNQLKYFYNVARISRLCMETPMEKELGNLFSSVQHPRSKLVKPTPGFCVKTYSNPEKKKLFVNICLIEDIPSPNDISSDELMHILHSDEPSSYRVPMSIGEGRSEHDKSGAIVTVYDVAINPKFFKKITEDNLFQTFFLTVVFEGLQDKYQCEIEMKNYIILKNRKSMGTLQSHRIEIRDVESVQAHLKSPLVQEIPPGESDDTMNHAREPVRNPAVSKSDKLVFRLRKESLPGEELTLIAEFKIPNNVNAHDLRLEVGEDRVTLEAQTMDASVDFFLPCSVQRDGVVAHLNRNTEILSVRMPTVN